MAKCSSTLENGTKERANVAVVMVPLPAQGHLNQLLHLSRLISAHDIPVHYVGTSTHIRQATDRVQGWDPLAVDNLHFHELPMPHFHSPPPNPDATTKFPSQLMPVLYATSHLRQPLIALIHNISTTKKRVIVIADSLMGWVVQDVPSIQNAEVYRFRCISAFTVYSFHREAAGKPVIGPEAEILNYLPSAEGCFIPEFSQFTKMQRKFWNVSSGDLLNSNRKIEALFLDFLAKEASAEKGLQWAVGPLNPVFLSNKTDSKNRHKCLEWLDRQAKNSALLVSFGTTTSLSNEQITELGIGLEESGQKFIWVLRDGDRGDVFDGEVRRAQLPEGYEERVREKGLVVRDWAPQLEILGHPSIGGFMSHCGWNSCMESISMGVPIVAWPMHSDQPRNATLITEVLRIGINLVDWARRNELVRRTEIGEGARKLMTSAEGEEMRQRAFKLSQSVKESITGGGGGRNELESFIAHITR